MDLAIEIKNLQKSFKELKAVNGISLQVNKGEIFAFLGRNGAGKSTTINMLCTFLGIDNGEIYVYGDRVGSNDDAVRRRIGVVFQGSRLDDSLTVYDNLRLRARLYNYSKDEIKERVTSTMESIGIANLANRRYGKLSGGQRRKVDVARGIIHSPDILILDEPSTGLDPQSRQQIWHYILKLNKEQGMTIFFTTHYMEEVAYAQRLSVIDKGRILVEGTPSEIREKYSTNRLIIDSYRGKKEGIKQYLGKFGIKFKQQDGLIVAHLNETKDAISILSDIKDDVKGFEVVKGTMDDAFINLTGREI